MDELLSEFLTETGEGLDLLDVELVRFEQDPNNADLLRTIFRLIHTVKGTCGFLGLDRLARLSHAAETLMGQYRDGAAVTVDGVTVILATIDRIKEILAALEREGAEPQGSDIDLIGALDDLALDQASGPTFDLDDASTADTAAWLADADAEISAAGGHGLRQREPSPADVEGNEITARSQSVRVNVDTLEHLMTMVSELVLTRNQLMEIVRRTGEGEFKSALQRLSSVTAELQEGIMKARMQPIANAWQKLPRLVRDLSVDLGKKIDLEMLGGDTELDRQVLEMIRDPLTHMVRNSADHGLETLQERITVGKPQTGLIKLSAYQQGGYIVIEVTDDGRGLNLAKIRAKALEKGLVSLADLDRYSDHDIHQLIFRPGFSTATAISEVSGRGVGMDVVRTNVELIGGTVELASTSDAGTTFIIKIPLTLAIVAALIVEACGQRFAIPQFSVVELVRAGDRSEHPIELINGAAVMRLRNRLLPLLDLSRILDLQGASSMADQAKSGILTVVVMQIGSHRFGVLVDSVFRTEEIVVKPLSNLLRHVHMFSGTTILGDGSVIMIIDPNALAAATGSLKKHTADFAEVEPVADEEHAQNVMPMLLFRAGTDMLKAIPLALITRLEEIKLDEIERCNGDDVVHYRGALMPLVSVGGDAGQRVHEGVRPVLVFTEGGRPAGLAIDEIVDIVETPLSIEIRADEPGLIGAAIINGNAVEIVDVSHYLGDRLGGRLFSPPSEASGMSRLLLVDDSQFFRNMLAPLLMAAGYDVTLAGSADEALAMKDRGQSFDLIISDLDMPGMDGIAFAGHVKSDPAWSGTPLVALSSYANPSVIERSRAAGFVSYVGKFDRQRLMDTLQSFSKEWGSAA